MGMSMPRTAIDTMPTNRGWSAPIAALLLLSACDGAVSEGQVSGLHDGCLESQGAISESLPVALVTCLIGPPTPDEVKIFVGLLNSDDRPRIVSSRFELFATLDVSITNDSGDELRTVSSWEPQTFSTDLLPILSWLLPRNGVVGRVVNLACDTEDVAYISASEECHRLFDFTGGDRFQIEVSLSRIQVCENFPCEEPLPDPVEFRSEALTLNLGD